MRVPVQGRHPKGIQIRDGEQFVIPSGSLTLSLNPLQSTGYLFRPGVEFIASTLFLEASPKKEREYVTSRPSLKINSVRPSMPFLRCKDSTSTRRTIWKKLSAIMESHRSTSEFWAFWTGMYLARARLAIQARNAAQSAWATACAERCRAMMLFKQSFEQVVWMGHSVKRIIDILKVWEANRENADEEFWQTVFNENSYVLSQVFAVPTVFIKDKAYVGGMNLERTDGRLVDFLFSAESSREAIVIEIKTPKTKLLAAKYRGLWPPSRELSEPFFKFQTIVRNWREAFEVSPKVKTAT